MRGAAIAGLLLGAAALASSAEAAPGRVVVERVRYVGTVSYSRVVIDLSQPAHYDVQLVSADGRSAPNRLVVDVDGGKVGPEAREPLTVGDKLLRSIRTGQYTLETARVVLDFAQAVQSQVFALPDPFRLIIDLRPQGPARIPSNEEVRRMDTARRPVFGERVTSESRRAEPAAGAVEPATASLPVSTGRSNGRAEGRRGRREVSAPAVPSPIFKIVLDPGHGGKDPGAEGVRGLLEKDVTLAVAKTLAARLTSEPGIAVALTREDDRYVPLEERTGFANAAGADLFVSIHANASPNRRLSGVEVYYLNNTNNRGTLRLAAMENNLHWDPKNPALAAEIPDLSYILSDLRQTYKVEESRLLAQSLGDSVVGRLGESYEDIHDLGVKEGPFYVLVGAYMPCVLVEMSFLTHPVEGMRLGTERYQRLVADGIYDGIQRYVTQAKLAKTL